MQPWNLSSRKQVATLRLPNLKDPRREIRTLRLEPTQESDAIACSVETCNLERPYSYTAISYTWGDPTPTKEIEVDGQRIWVHANCFHAFWQIRHCYPPVLGTPRVWIDAICIDQGNLQEKSLQVQAMHRIFGKAEKVAISLGPATENGDVLERELRGLRSLAKDMRQARPDLLPESRMFDSTSGDFWIDKALSERARLRPESFQRLSASFCELGNRSYWSRLWIVQELHAAQNIEILSGKIKYDWDWFKSMRLEKHFGYKPMQKAMPYLVNPQIKSTLRVAQSGLSPLRSTIDGYKSWQCSDPRDRIYGLLSVMQRDDGSASLEVDYTKSALQLAMEALRIFTARGQLTSDIQDLVSTTTALVRALEITPEQTDVASFLIEGTARRAAYFLSGEVVDGSNAPALDTSSTAPLITVEANDRGAEWWRVQTENLGDSILQLSGSYLEPYPQLSDLIDWSENVTQSLRDIQAVALRIDDAVVALACPGTRQDDLIVPVELDDEISSVVGLVLRERADGICYIIGPVFLHPDVRSCGRFDARRGKACRACSKAHQPKTGRMRLLFNPDDWISFMGLIMFSGIALPSQRLLTAFTCSRASSYAVVEVQQALSGANEDDGDADSPSSDGALPLDWSRAAWNRVKIVDEIVVEEGAK